MAKIKVLLAEDHTIVRKGLRALLDDAANIMVVAEASDGRDALAKVEDKSPNVVLMDISMPLLNGLEATRLIKKKWPEVRVVMLTMHSKYEAEALRAGTDAFLVKGCPTSDLLNAFYAEETN